MKELLAVFIGGGTGSVLRFALGKWLNPLIAKFFLGTFTANFLSCVIFGVILALIDRKLVTDQIVIKLLLVGFCGGFSTFSTFTFENEQLLKQEHYLHLILYLVVSIALCLVALKLGMRLGSK